MCNRRIRGAFAWTRNVMMGSMTSVAVGVVDDRLDRLAACRHGIDPDDAAENWRRRRCSWDRSDTNEPCRVDSS